MKAGTTSLYKYLAGHPDLYPSPKKEPRVFREAGGPDDQRAKLLALFEGRRAERWCFEGSTAYTKYPIVQGVPRRIASAVPDAQFVYLVRNPVDRTWSQYVHNVAHGREVRPFARAVVECPQYLEISRYYMQLQQYYEVFPPDRVLVQVFEEMVKDPVVVVRAICDFLGVSCSYRPPNESVAYNASKEKRVASRSLRMMKTLGVEERVPWRVRRWLKAHGAPLPEKEMGLTPELRAQVAEALRRDTEAFFGLVDRRIPSWSDFA